MRVQAPSRVVSRGLAAILAAVAIASSGVALAQEAPPAESLTAEPQSAALAGAEPTPAPTDPAAANGDAIPTDGPGAETAAEPPPPAFEDEVRREIAELRAEILDLRRELSTAGATRAAPPSPTIEESGRRVRGIGGPLVIAAGEVVDRADNLGGPIRVHGTVRGDARAIGGDIHVFEGGEIQGSASTVGGDIRVDPGGKLAGAANVVGGKVLVKPGGNLGAPNGAIGPAAALTALPETSGWWQAAWDFGASLYQRLVFLLAFAGAGVLVIALMPQRIHHIADQLAERPFLSGFIGVVGTLLAAVASLLLLPTLIGPFLLLSALGIAWMMGFVALCQVVGDRLNLGARPAGRWLAFLAGSVILSFLGALPWIGVLVVVAASLMGVGAAIASRYGASPQRA